MDIVSRIPEAKHSIKHELNRARSRAYHKIRPRYGLGEALPRLCAQLFDTQEQYDGKRDADSHQAEGGAAVPCAGEREGKQRSQPALPAFSSFLLFLAAVPVVNSRKNGLAA